MLLWQHLEVLLLKDIDEEIKSYRLTSQYTMATFHKSFRNAMQMGLGFFVKLFCMSIHSIICRRP